MQDNGSTISVKYGRVGSTECTANYPSSKWTSLYNSKIKKGYKDVTGLRVETESIDFLAISNDVISAFVAELQALAKRSVQSNYTVSSDTVTQAQVDEAQRILDKLANLISKKRKDNKLIDNSLLELYQTIPRKMQHVQDHLVSGGHKAEDIITEEQATLDVMKGQVRVNTMQQTNTIEDKKTILEAMGLVIDTVSNEEIILIKKELGEISNKFKRAFKVINKRTQERFDKYVASKKNKTCKLLWHGSRNENWWNILDSGLLLRPTNVITTGKMYGAGIYTANKAKKSLGYTSINGSYWARGNSNKAYMALFRFHTGNQYIASKHESWMGQLTYEKLKKLGDYDSFYAKGGVDLINDEFIIYQEDQADIQFIVELQ